jgi:hypothetical protein
LLKQIQLLYRVEARLREQGAGPNLRAAARAHESRPVVERLRRALVRLKGSGRHLPQSLLGIALDYALGQWTTLEVFLDNGRIEIDNNGVYAVHGINPVMPPSDLCRVDKLEANIPTTFYRIGCQCAA